MLAKLLAPVGVLVCGVILYDAVVIAVALYRGSSLAEASEVFEQNPVRPKTNLLVVGDSTAVGTGATTPILSVAGRLGTDLPRLRVSNLGEDGAVTADVVSQLRQVKGQKFGAILIQTGGNDVLQFTGADALRQHLDTLLELSVQHSDHVFVMSVGDVGRAPAVPWPLSILLSRRAQIVRGEVQELSEKYGASFIDFDAASQLFVKDPDKFYASDGLHPSDEGYAQWYGQLREQSKIGQVLTSPP
ncbi:MAG: hypothetical protein Cons2KO_12670 [Congregibacter sp.]